MNKLIRVGAVAVCAALPLSASWSPLDAHGGGRGRREFERVSTFIVCENTSCDRSEVPETVSEIVTASRDGLTLAYVDALLPGVGFVDIADPEHPAGRGTLGLPEGTSPTSVATAGRWFLVVVNTSPAS
jgi:hypothetical protein